MKFQFEFAEDKASLKLFTGWRLKNGSNICYQHNDSIYKTRNIQIVYHIGSKCKISSDTIHGGIYITHAAALKHQFSRTKKKKNVLNQFRMRRIMLQNRNKLWNIASVKYCQGNRRRFTIVYNNNTLFLLCARCANFLNGNPTNFKIDSSQNNLQIFSW